ncbi:hypothetical protein HPB51_005158 [Rhipicephalus microplus]|uniref:Disintegrin domain-containing protein n=1 Tax=Rhipicephalus microplus TaxID=6941 RepID=A0A9J6DLQ5_RHIMP|nr:hypothetical protein HPB51_005158 [Rhipicephalus microplus]
MGTFASRKVPRESTSCTPLRPGGDRPNNDRFSPCSIGNMSAILKPLFNRETSRENCFLRHSGPACGNQIVEGDEQCDCGATEAECTDKCCYSRNCGQQVARLPPQTIRQVQPHSRRLLHGILRLRAERRALQRGD